MSSRRRSMSWARPKPISLPSGRSSRTLAWHPRRARCWVFPCWATPDSSSRSKQSPRYPDQSPVHPDTGGERMVVGAGADLAVVAEIEGRVLGDGGVGGNANDGGIALRGGAEHREGTAERARKRGGDRPGRVGIFMRTAQPDLECQPVAPAEIEGAGEV